MQVAAPELEAYLPPEHNVHVEVAPTLAWKSPALQYVHPPLEGVPRRAV
jgi:hypothetical protein